MKLSPSERRTLTLVGLGFILLLGFALGLKPFLAGDEIGRASCRERV